MTDEVRARTAQEIHNRISIVKSHIAMEDDLLENVYLELESSSKFLLKFKDVVSWHLSEICKAKRETAEEIKEEFIYNDDEGSSAYDKCNEIISSNSDKE